MQTLKKINVVFIICFILIITIPTINVNLRNNMISTAENRYLASFPCIIDMNTGKINGNILKEFENWFNDNIGFREQIVKLNSNVTYRLLHTSPNDRVHIGENDWFFYTMDNNLEIGSGTYPISNELLETIKEKQEAIQQALAKKGIEYVLVLTPSKASIYPEMLSGSDYSIGETLIDVVANYLRENTTITVINTKEDLIKARDTIQVYYKDDTHWNQEGAYIGYRQIIRTLKEKGIINSDVVDIEKIESTHEGEFAAMMGDASLLEHEKTIDIQVKNPKAITVVRDDILTIAGNVSGSYFTINNEQNKKLLLYGDSFIGLGTPLRLLSENFNELYFMWSDRINSDVVNAVNPDIVMMERTERYLYNLGNEVDHRLLYEPLKSWESQILLEDTPTTIKRGEKYNITITVKNTSQDIWNENKQVRLCIWQDGQDYGYRIHIPEGVDVKPGETIEFVLKDFQAPPTETTILEYQMLEEGITYFGDKKSVEISIKD